MLAEDERAGSNNFRIAEDLTVWRLAAGCRFRMAFDLMRKNLGVRLERSAQNGQTGGHSESQVELALKLFE